MNFYITSFIIGYREIMNSSIRATKHVSRACLECRSRHMKCGGQEPKCERCSKYNRDCQYVKSNRGGSRKKGVKIIKPISNMLPCVTNNMEHLAHEPDCSQDCLSVDNFNKIPPCLKGHHSQSSNNDDGVDFYPTFNATNDTTSLDIIFNPQKISSSLDQCYISPVLTKDLNVDLIIDTFYNNFHECHPFLPPREYIMDYLNAIPLSTDLILAMKLIGDGQTTNIFSKDSETINFLVNSILDYVKQIGKDFISLQTLLILSMIAHISSLHDLSVLLREALLTLTLELKMNHLDESSLPEMFMDVNGNIADRCDTESLLNNLLKSRRVSNIPKDILIDTVRRTFWEIYFFDTISGTASGQYKSRIAMVKCLVLFPTTTTMDEFDFKSRAEACKLVNDAISLNVAIQNKKNFDVYLTHMKAALGNWEMKLSNPNLYDMPYIVDVNGRVNEGLFESVVLLNYARIFTHRPFSFLWRSDVSKHPRCTADPGIDDPCPEPAIPYDDRRKIIETRRTIDSANSLIKTILDTDASSITKRTPFIACGLAFSGLVHLSAYSWVDTNLNEQKNNMTVALDNNKSLDISHEELAIYSEYIKLEIGSILQISKHWSLSAKLVQHIVETLIKVSSSLWGTIQRGVPELRHFNLMQHKKSVVEEETPPETKEAVELGKSHSEATVTSNSEFSNHTNSIEGPPTSSSFMNDFTSLELNLMNNNNNANTNANFNGNIDFNSGDNYGFPQGYLNPLSPTSETGCDWVDKNVFEFDPMSLNISIAD